MRRPCLGPWGLAWTNLGQVLAGEGVASEAESDGEKTDGMEGVALRGLSELEGMGETRDES